MMKPGKYYVGDLCYVLHDRWDEFCDLTIDGNNCLSGEFKLKDGTVLATYNTMYGDGLYTDKEGREYGVDAGLIGCVLVDSVKLGIDGNDLNGGHIIEFKRPFSTGRSIDGVIFFGDEVAIATGDEDDEEDF
jgi:hypothetical protein